MNITVLVTGVFIIAIVSVVCGFIIEKKESKDKTCVCESGSIVMGLLENTDYPIRDAIQYLTPTNDLSGYLKG